MHRGGVQLAIGQMDCVVGDVKANLAKVERMALDAARQGCNLIVFPELSLCGYAVGPEFAKSSITPDCEEIRALQRLSREIGIVVGAIEETEDTQFYNSAIYLQHGKVRHVHRKVYLPNYRVFDERRYFGSGPGVWAFETPWCRMAILICGDAWHLPLPYLAAHDGASILIFIAASSTKGLTPMIDVQSVWERMNLSYALTLTNFVVFANRVGRETMEDSGVELDFWGGSQVCGPHGNVLVQAPNHEEDLLCANLDLGLLRAQRLILPFRRDDSLSFTLDIGRRILRGGKHRRDGFFSLLGRPDGAGDDAADPNTYMDPPPAPTQL